MNSKLNNNSKSQMKKQNQKKKKILYTYENSMTESRYMEMTKYFPEIYWHYVYSSTIIFLIFAVLGTIVTKKIFATLIFVMFAEIIIILICRSRFEGYISSSYKIMVKKGIIKTKSYFEFYENFFIIRRGDSLLEINYDEINKCVVTDTDVYLKCSKINMIIMIQYNENNNELIDFIKNKYEYSKTKYKDKSTRINS